MSTFLVVGAGGVGRATAAVVAGQGHEVRLASRSGTDPGLPGVTAVRVDATNADQLSRLASGAAAIINAVNPVYTRWATDWPPLATAFIRAAETSGAGLVIVGNLYAYGAVNGPITPELPLTSTGTKGQVRAQMWREALAAHQAGRVRAAEIRASDYFGPGAGPRVSYLNEFVLRPASRGKSVRLIIGAPDVPHSFTYLPDIATTAAAVATSDVGWGRAWHVPTAPARTIRQVVDDVASITGRPAVSIRTTPAWLRRTMGLVIPIVRELDETAHQFERPFIVDSSATEAQLGLTATPWPQALPATLQQQEQSVKHPAGRS